MRGTAYRSLFDLHRMPVEWDGLWWRLGLLGYVEDARDATARPPRMREWAGTSAVAAALHTALDDPDPLVRRAAVENATFALDRGTVDRLLRLFENPQAAGVRPAILAALGSARDARAAGPALAVLRHPSEHADLVLPAIAAARQRGGPAEKGGAGYAGGGRGSATAAGRRAGGCWRTGGERCCSRRRRPSQPPRRGSADRCRRCPDPDRRGSGPAVPDFRTRRRGPRGPAARRDRPRGAAGEGRGSLAAEGVSEPRYAAAGDCAPCPASPTRRALEVYLEGLGAKNPGVREECHTALAAIRQQVRPQIRDRLASGTLPAPVVVELATIFASDPELAPLLASARGRPKMDDYAAFALANRGDPVRGRAVFDDPRGVGCIKCHRINGSGGEGGPDLSRVAANYGRSDLIESVLFPSKKVADGFRTTTVRASGRPDPLGSRRRGRGRSTRARRWPRGASMTCGRLTSSSEP